MSIETGLAAWLIVSAIALVWIGVLCIVVWWVAGEARTQKRKP